MGRQTSSSFDDVLQEKCRRVITGVLSRLNEHGEFENIDALYSKHARDTARDLANDSTTEAENSKLEYTYEHFVQHLDENDESFHHLMELLITITARQSILKAVEANEAKDGEGRSTTAEASARRPTSTANTVTSSGSSASYLANLSQSISARASQREALRSRALQGEICRITVLNRRVQRSDESSDSSDSLRSATPPATRTLYSSLNESSSRRRSDFSANPSTLRRETPRTAYINESVNLREPIALGRITREFEPLASARIYRPNRDSSETTRINRVGGDRRDLSSLRRRAEQRTLQRQRPGDVFSRAVTSSSIPPPSLSSASAASRELPTWSTNFRSVDPTLAPRPIAAPILPRDAGERARSEAIRASSERMQHASWWQRDHQSNPQRTMTSAEQLARNIPAAPQGGTPRESAFSNFTERRRRLQREAVQQGDDDDSQLRRRLPYSDDADVRVTRALETISRADEALRQLRESQ